MHPEIERTIAKIRTSKTELFFQILLVFILPIFLISADVIPINVRVPALTLIFSGLLFILIFFERWNLSMFALRKSSIKKYAIPYLVFTLIMMLLAIGFGEYILKTEELKRWWTHSHFLYLFFVVSLVQEIAYRGYLIPALGKLSKNVPFVVFANTIIFTLLHAIFPNPMMCLPVAFVGGLGFALMYIKYPSLPLIILSHSVLNFCVVLFGFFVVPGVTY